MNGFIQAIRTRNDAIYQDTGNRPTMYVRTYGCQMNVRESEHLEGVLLAMGYAHAAAEKDADLVLYNTCSVRENAENKVFGSLGYLKFYKETRPGMVIALCGCMAQRETVVEKLRTTFRHVDVVFGTFNRKRFPQLLYTYITTGKQVIDTDETLDLTPETDMALETAIGASDGLLQAETGFLPAESAARITVTTRGHRYKAGVNVMYGCNNFCTYCIVPYVRGRERSRTPEDILAEVQALADDGVQEILLLGQNVNAYGAGLSAPIDFAALLHRVNAVKNIRRIRFTTSHPKDLSPALMAAIQDCEKVCRHVHLPFQSGSTRVLAKMNRKYTQADYLAQVQRLKETVPGVALSTDVIVGFPGETEEDFLDTLEVIRQVDFSGVFTFLYSKREGTPAATMEDAVPPAEASRRFQALMAVINPMLLARNQRREGQRVAVMAEDRELGETGRMTGRTEDNTPVHFPGGSIQPGEMTMVRVTQSKTFYLIGESEGALLPGFR